MTLIVGIVCRDTVVLGAESETTRGPAKYQGTDKLHLIGFKGGGYAVVGESGSDHPAGVCIDALNRVAPLTPVHDEYTIPTAVETAFREAVKRGHGPKMGTRKCQEFHGQEDNFFQLLIGYYFKGIPFLYEFNSYFATARKCSRAFAANGVGRDLAEYILGPLDVAQMCCNEAVFSIIYAAGEVKTSVSGCGGPTQIAIVPPNSKPVKLTRESLGLMESRAYGLRERLKANLVEMKQNIREAALAYVSNWRPFRAVGKNQSPQPGHKWRKP